MRTHAVLVIGLYELLGNQSTNSLSHPDPHYWLKDLDNLTLLYILYIFILM
jgi:hypothetical protein